MAFGTERRTAPTRVVERAVIDEGLRTYMLSVYNYMASGLALTGAVAFFVANTPVLMNAVFGTPLIWLVMFSPLIIVFMLSARIHKMSVVAAQATFWVFATLMGMSLASIFIVYTGTSIARVFFITAGVFGAMSLYGYTTKRDLTGWGSFLFMGLIGVIIASIVNIFLGSSMLYFAISVIGVLVFTGLTAYDTQKIKEMYVESDASAVATKKAIMGALRLYLDFINLFLMLLRLFGNRN
ncbi:MAG: Bax inhibitor-1/YccA family protein [Alphaproteobacteria bacterium]